MSKKKKIQLNKVLFNNRHCAIFMLIVFVVFAAMLDSFVVNAESYSYSSDVVSRGGNGSFVSAGNAVDVFNWVKNDNQQFPFLNGYTLRSYYTGSGDLYTSGNNSAGFPTITAYGDWIYSDSGERVFIVPTEISAQNHTSSMAINGAYYVGTYSPSTASSQQWIKSYLFQSAGNVAMISYYDSNNNRSYLGMISDQPLYYQFTRSMAYFGQVTTVFCGLVDEQVNGYYFYGFDSYEEVWVANCPIYLASTDKASGFTTLDEFSFSGNNTQFNYLLTNGEVIDPVGGNGSDDDIISSDGLNYNFGYANVQFSQFGDNSSILATWSLNMNEYMRLHPYDFQFCSKYTIKIQTVSGVKEFSTDFSPYIADVLKHGDQNYLCNMSFDNMNDGSQSLSLYLKSIFGQTADSALYSDGSVISYGVTNPSSGSRSFGGFTLGVKQYFDNIILSASFEFDGYFKFLGNPETESGHIKGTYNLKTGETKITKDDITTNYNPPENNNNGLSNYGGSNVPTYGSGSAVATIQSGAIQVFNSCQHGFMISDQDWNEYGNLIESMGEDMRAVSSGEGYNGVFQMFANAYSVFPAKVWALITLGIGGSVTLALWKKGTQCH